MGGFQQIPAVGSISQTDTEVNKDNSQTSDIQQQQKKETEK